MSSRRAKSSNFVVVRPEKVRSDMVTSQVTIGQDSTIRKSARLRGAPPESVVSDTEITSTPKKPLNRDDDHNKEKEDAGKSFELPLASSTPRRGRPMFESSRVKKATTSASTPRKKKVDKCPDLEKLLKTFGQLSTMLVNKLVDLSPTETSDEDMVDNIYDVRNLPDYFPNDTSIVDLQLLIDFLRNQKDSLETKQDYEFESTNQTTFLLTTSKIRKTRRTLSCPKEDCNYTCLLEPALEKHINSFHLQIPAYECEDCTQKFISSGLLDQHIRDEHQDIIESTYLPCSYEDCKSHFKTDATRRAHERSYHEKRFEFMCEWPNCEFVGKSKSQIECHEARHNGIRPFICSTPDCGKSFRTRESIRRHEVTHCQEKRFLCTWKDCGKRFKLSRTYREHLARHKEIKFMKCLKPDCTFRTTNRHRLQVHQTEMHDMAKPYPCTWAGCTKAFFTRQKLAIHLRIHNNDRSIICPHEGCEKSFVERGNMLKHFNNIHGPNARKRLKKAKETQKSLAEITEEHESESESTSQQKTSPPSIATTDTSTTYVLMDVNDAQQQQQQQQLVSTETGLTYCVPTYVVDSTFQILQPTTSDMSGDTLVPVMSSTIPVTDASAFISVSKTEHEEFTTLMPSTTDI